VELVLNGETSDLMDQLVALGGTTGWMGEASGWMGENSDQMDQLAAQWRKSAPDFPKDWRDGWPAVSMVGND
jgi:hypothetical protein